MTYGGRGFKSNGPIPFRGTKVFCRCPLTEIKSESGVLNQVALRSDYVNQSENVATDDNKNDDNDIKPLACSNNICAIVADKISVDTVWFLLINDSDCCNHAEESKDAYGHIVPVSQPSLKCNYLERLNQIKKDAICKRCKKELFSYKESMFTR